MEELGNSLGRDELELDYVTELIKAGDIDGIHELFPAICANCPGLSGSVEKALSRGKVISGCEREENYKRVGETIRQMGAITKAYGCAYEDAPEKLPGIGTEVPIARGEWDQYVKMCPSYRETIHRVLTARKESGNEYGR